jgi:hypothetical protein
MRNVRVDVIDLHIVAHFANAANSEDPAAFPRPVLYLQACSIPFLSQNSTTAPS